jgi:hypothetical protein
MQDAKIASTRGRRRATWRVRAQYTVQTRHVRCNLQRSRTFCAVLRCGVDGSFYAPSAVVVDQFSMNDDCKIAAAAFIILFDTSVDEGCLLQVQEIEQH